MMMMMIRHDDTTYCTIMHNVNVNPTKTPKVYPKRL